jgi:hypothetical protein
MSAPAGNGATDKVVIEVDGDDSPLSSASPGVVRLPRWDDLGRSYSLNSNLMHKFIPSFSFRGTVTKPRSSSRVVIPCLSSAAIRDGSYQPGNAYHSTHEDRRDFAAARALWGTRDDGSPTNLGLVERFWLISSPTKASPRTRTGTVASTEMHDELCLS